jgi:hypothetical protein
MIMQPQFILMMTTMIQKKRIFNPRRKTLKLNEVQSVLRSTASGTRRGTLSLKKLPRAQK